MGDGPLWEMGRPLRRALPGPRADPAPFLFALAPGAGLGRASFGFARFFGRRFSIGAELCATVLYREQLSGPYWDYSGAGGQLDGRFRMTF